MRTFLTYVLAALAAAFVLAAAANLPGIASVALAGEPRLAGGMVSEALVSFMLWAVLLGAVGSAAWLLGGFVVRSFGVPGDGIWVTVRGSLIFWILFAGLGWMLFGTDLFVFERGGELLPIHGLLTALGVFYLPGLFFVVGGAVIGAIWGTVFWLRAPKAQTAGIAA